MSEKLIIELVLQPKAENDSFKKVEDKATKAGKKAGSSFSKSFSTDIKSGLAGAAKGFLGLAAAVTVARAAFGGFKEAIGTMIIFQKSIFEINSILPKNAKLTEQSTAAIEGFSASFGTKQQGQARAFYNIVSAGVKGTSKQLRTLSIANKAAVAGLVDIDSAAKVLVSSVNAYSKSAISAKEVSDILFVAVREGQTTFGELADSFGNVTSIASNAGVKFEDLAGALAFITKSGIKTDVATTGLKGIFTSIIKPSKEAADEAKRLGLEFTTAAVRSKGLAGFLADLGEKTAGNEKSLAKLFGNVRALGPILNIVNGDFKDFNRILEETRKASGSTQDAFKIISASLDFKLDKAGSEIMLLGTNIGKFLLPVLTEVVDSFTTAIRLTNKWFKPKSVKTMDVLQASIKETKKLIAETQKDIEKFGAMPQKTLFGGISESGRIKKQNEKELIEQKQRLDDLRDFKKIHIIEQANLDADLIKNNKNKNDSIEESDAAAFAGFKMLGLSKQDALITQFHAELAILDAAKEAKEQTLVDQAEFDQRRIVLEENLNAELNKLDEAKVMSAEVSAEGVGKALKIVAKNAKMTSGDLAKTFHKLAVNGIGKAFESMGAAIANGGNAMQAFADSMKQMLGNLAGALGDYFIAQGIAHSADPKAIGSGAGMIAGGLGLKVLAGALGASGGSGSSSESGSSSSSGEDTIETSGTLLEEQELAEEKQNIQLVVNGDVFNTEETGRTLLDLLNENFDNTGGSLTNAKFA